MKNFIVFAAIMLLCLSCNPILYPLPGKNYDEISNIKSVQGVDSAWGSVHRFLAANGFTIKEEDKKTGVVTTDNHDFGKQFSFVKGGKPMDSTAWVALSYVTNKGGFGDAEFHVYAHWTVQVKQAGTGSMIRIDLSKVDAGVQKAQKKSFHPAQDYTFAGQSTGVFEKKLADALR